MNGIHDTGNHYSLEELSALTGVSRRTIRYYIQLELVDRPDGETRAARYGPRHLEQLTRVRRLSAEGFSLNHIRHLIKEIPTAPAAPPPGTAETWTRLFLAGGVELGLNPRRSRLSPEALRLLIRGVIDLYARLERGEGPARTAEPAGGD